jgi:dTDP-4-amino-4,6-dideoxygalactose transaminase
VLVENRRAVFDGMRDAEIGVQVHYVPVHHHPISHDISQGASDLPICESVYERIISLPVHPRLTDEDQDFVVKTLLSLQ